MISEKSVRPLLDGVAPANGKPTNMGRRRRLWSLFRVCLPSVCHDIGADLTVHFKDKSPEPYHDPTVSIETEKAYRAGWRAGIHDATVAVEDMYKAQARHALREIPDEKKPHPGQLNLLDSV